MSSNNRITDTATIVGPPPSTNGDRHSAGRGSPDPAGAPSFFAMIEPKLGRTLLGLRFGLNPGPGK